jgi:hypothetical protein
MDSSSLAMTFNYHQAGINCIYGFHILRGHLWGGRFQMITIEGSQEAAGKGGNPSGPEGWKCSG